MPATGVQHVEMRLLLEGVFRVYGHDFRDYAEASLHRRLHKIRNRNLGNGPIRKE